MERLARESARLAGESLTTAVKHALEDRLMRLKGRRTVPSVEADIMTISRRCAALPDLDTRGADEIMGYTAEGILNGH